MTQIEIATKTQITQPIIKKIALLFEPLEKASGIQVFIHGSCADNSTTAFSDIDDFIVIDDTSLSPKEQKHIETILNEIEKQFYKVDPLQHHGHWKIFKSELSHYNNSYLPVFILENAICLIGDNKLKATIDYYVSYCSLVQRIKSTLKNIDVFYSKFHEKRLNIYDLKRLIGSIALIPPLLFQLKGYSVDKKSAIERAAELFSQKALLLLQWATELRLNWHLTLIRKEYSAFILNQNKQFNNWPEFAAQNAPVVPIDREQTKIKLTQELVEQFIKESFLIVDTSIIQEKSKKEYDEVYQSVEKFAIRNGALMVGQFGEIKHPGISDLDIFFCFTDNIYKNSSIKVKEFISRNQKFPFFFTHPPVCVSESMLPHLPYLHTLSNLRLTHNSTNFQPNTHALPSEYKQWLNSLWNILILPLAQHAIDDIRFKHSRELLLRLKNIHTSICNIRSQRGQSCDALQRSHNLRNLTIKDPAEVREGIQREFISSFRILLNLISEEEKFRKDHFFVGRKLVFRNGNFEKISKNGTTIISLPNKYYQLIKSYYRMKPYDKQLIIYLAKYEYLNALCSKLKVNNPVTFLLCNYTQIAKPNKFKKAVFSIIEKLPLSLVTKIL